MNKLEFMTLLKSELEKFQVSNIADIMADYEEHFHHGLASGKSEQDICSKLGSPLTIAKAYQTESMIKEVKKNSTSFKWGLALTVLGRLLIIAPFNFFIFFIPGLIVLSLLIAGWAVALGVAAAAFAIFSFIPGISALATSLWIAIGGLTAGLATLCFGIFGLMIMFLISKFVVMGLINYMQWNLNFILQSSEK